MNTEASQTNSAKKYNITVRTFTTQNIIYRYRYLEPACIILIENTIRNNAQMANKKRIPSIIGNTSLKR